MILSFLRNLKCNLYQFFIPYHDLCFNNFSYYFQVSACFFFVLECEIHFLKGVRERHVVVSRLKTAENYTNKMTVALVHFLPHFVSLSI